MSKKITDLERLQGAWRITALDVDGQSMPAAGGIVIKGRRFTGTGMGGGTRVRSCSTILWRRTGWI
jgi:hypothetical protein